MSTVGHFLHAHLGETESVHSEVMMTGTRNVVFVEDDPWKVNDQTRVRIARVCGRLVFVICSRTNGPRRVDGTRVSWIDFHQVSVVGWIGGRIVVTHVQFSSVVVKVNASEVVWIPVVGVRGTLPLRLCGIQCPLREIVVLIGNRPNVSVWIHCCIIPVTGNG